MFKNPFSFDGRIRRTEYGISYIIYFAGAVIINVISALLATNIDPGLAGIMPLALSLPLLYFFIAQTAKRCHDRGHSGWYQLIPFYNLYLLFAESKYGPNEYGPNPKEEGNHQEIEKIGVEEE
ncbi:DUF805 domain-containing protein [Sinomicrobium weinanense]|uniref:DUF805 domain-containing protein n=1 Tax=Sinomicrobium weinanense TaxID=2842200 RepID=A0A926JPD2_9FLAO|nr:DUF805 domain-containing protein [Sinomicrobium weinanense]MBC9794914.1 DUF805 domain-containing protein [Sinomicrobium weinanense]MBU3125685.1 DUF805 domain-containing protein [Sinomicrobium weinanense]